MDVVVARHIGEDRILKLEISPALKERHRLMACNEQ